MTPEVPRILGRYAVFGEIAAGGMATVHFGRLIGDGGFSRVVAIKRLHAQYAREPEFVAMFLDEARLASRIRHPNVVSTLDVVAADGEVFLVLEYVPGLSLARLLRAHPQRRAPAAIASSIARGMLLGLHAAHEATDDAGQPLELVHRDVSPQNVLVTPEGEARVLDFGVAKATGRLHTTRDGAIKGKVAYMSPEQLHGEEIDRRADIYAAGVVLWEMLTGERLFGGASETVMVKRVLERAIRRPSEIEPSVPAALDAVVMRALAERPSQRFATAKQMALAVEEAVRPAGPTQVGAWVEEVASDTLAERASTVAWIESQRDPLAVASMVTRTDPRWSRRRRIGFLALVGALASTAGAIAILASRAPGPTQAARESAPAPRRTELDVATSEPAPVVVPQTPPSTERPLEARADATKAPEKAPAKVAAPRRATSPIRPCIPAWIDDAGIKRYNKCP